MQSMDDILRQARPWTLLRERQAGATRRSVFRVEDRYVVKKFEIPLAVRSYRRPWVAEDACLRRLGGAGAPRSFGWVEQIEGDRRIVFLGKEYVDGQPLGSFSADDIPAAARLMARIHGRRLITDDANPGNFIRTPDGELRFLDLGRGRLFHRTGPWLDLHIGWELAKLRREAFRWDPSLWTAFLPPYFHALSASRRRRAFLLAAGSAATALRRMRKISQGKSPRS